MSFKEHCIKDFFFFLEVSNKLPHVLRLTSICALAFPFPHKPEDNKAMKANLGYIGLPPTSKQTTLGSESRNLVTDPSFQGHIFMWMEIALLGIL